MHTVSRVEINGWLRRLEDAELLMRHLPLTTGQMALDVGTAIGKVLTVRHELQEAVTDDVAISGDRYLEPNREG